MIWWRGQRTQLSFFCSQSVGKNCLILELCPLPSFIPSLHKHKKRRGEISGNNTRQDCKIVVWISPCPVMLKWYCMSCRVKYSCQKIFYTPMPSSLKHCSIEEKGRFYFFMYLKIIMMLKFHPLITQFSQICCHTDPSEIWRVFNLLCSSGW